MKSLVVCATQKSDPKETLLYQSLVPLKEKGAKFEAEFHTSNKEGLSKLYNNVMKRDRGYDCYVFVHDDVYIDDAFIFDKIEEGFQLYDIIGVAGASDPKIKAPALWHLMTERFNWSGSAGHFVSKDRIAITSFGAMPAKVDILDGVLLAVNRMKYFKSGWQFNENYTFHHYDIASCLDAGKKKLTCGVLPIHIIHQSPGLRDIHDPVFTASQTQFLKEYGS